MMVFKAVFAKDLNLMFRRSGFFFVAIVVSLGLFMLFRFSYPAEKLDFIIGNTMLWVVHLIGSLFILIASLEWEHEWGASRLYNVTGANPAVVFLAKASASFLALWLLWVIDLLIWLFLLVPRDLQPDIDGFAFLFQFSLNLAPAGFLTSMGLAISGTLSAAIAVHGRYRHILLFVIKFPLTLPLVIAASSFSRAVFKSGSLTKSFSVLNLEIAFVFLFLAAGVGLYEYLLEE